MQDSSSKNRLGALLHHPALYCVVGAVCAFAFPSVRSSWFGMFFLCLLITVYAFYARMARNNPDNPADQREAGDHCYLIGFVYTLIVIVATLSRDAEQLVDSPDALLATVGIALGTSVWGMVCRFFLIQGAHMPEDRYEEHINAVAASSHELSAAVRSISGAADEYKNSFQSTARVMADYAEIIKKQAEHITQGVDEPFSTLLNNLSQRIDRMFDTNLFANINTQLEQVIQRQNEALVLIEERLKKSTGELGGGAAAAAESAREIEKSTKQFADIKEQLGEIVQGQEKALSLIRQQLDGFNAELKEGADATTVKTRAIREQVAKTLQEELEAISKIYADAEERLKSLGQQYKNLSQKATKDLYDGLIDGAKQGMAEREKNNPPRRR